MSRKKERREKARLKYAKGLAEGVEELQKEEAPKIQEKQKLTKAKLIFERDYKKLLIIPILLLILTIAQIGYQISTTGDFVNKGISLKGGITITIPNADYPPLALQEALIQEVGVNDIAVRTITAAGKQAGLIVDAGITESEKQRELASAIESQLKLTKDDYSLNMINPSLGESFFRQIFKALIMAFAFMGAVVFLCFANNTMAKIIVVALSFTAALVVFFADSIFSYAIALVLGIVTLYYFIKYSIPSVAVILAAFSDIVITLAIFNLTGMKLSTAGVAAFLMLIGYSVDTDILLSTRVLRRKEGTVMDAIYSAIKTGLTMQVITLVALVMGLFFSQSEVLKQIMLILFIGLLVDIINTWIQNVGILRMYLEKNEQGKKNL